LINNVNKSAVAESCSY